jgi:CubicO group peptidase (beta-lactamase class C family)
MERMEYSDIGFILLGEILQRIAGERLEEFCSREVFVPLKLNVKFGGQSSVIEGVPPTEIEATYRNRVIQGEVHDQNTSAMGGIAPHAGLFGDALSIARFAESMLGASPALFKPETVRLFTTREAGPEGTSRALGWDTPSGTSQSGTRFSKRSFGHTGFTGTSLWCDAERGLSVTMLTNRTWPDALDNSIKQVRPKIHDAIVSALEDG